MRSYTINLPRGLEVDIFNLPDNFVEEINRVFREYTQETAKDYRDCDRLGFTLGTIFGVVGLICVAIVYDKHHPGE